MFNKMLEDAVPGLVETKFSGSIDLTRRTDLDEQQEETHHPRPGETPESRIVSCWERTSSESVDWLNHHPKSQCADHGWCLCVQPKRTGDSRRKEEQRNLPIVKGLVRTLDPPLMQSDHLRLNRESTIAEAHNPRQKELSRSREN